MSNYTITPNMALKNPTPGVDPGPDYANNIEDALNTVDSHTHTGASNSDGQQIPAAGININDDLSAQSNNLTNLRSTRYVNQGSALNGVGDIDCVYFEGGNLWINNGSGTAVQVTAGNVVNVSASINWTLLAVTSNHSINTSDNVTVLSCDSTSGTITITLPVANTVPAGRIYIVKDATGESQTNAITVNPAGSDNIEKTLTTLVIADNFSATGFISDSVSNWELVRFDRKIYGASDTISFASGATLSEDGYSNVHLKNVALQGLVTLSPVVITNGNNPYTISASTPYGANVVPLFLMHFVGSILTVNLPAASSLPGALFIFKDYLGSANPTQPMTIAPNGSDTIENVAANYLIQTPYQSLTLYSLSPTASGWAIL